MAQNYSTAGAKASPATRQSGNLAIRDSQGLPEGGLRNHHTGPSAECRDGVVRRVRVGQQIVTAYRGGPRAAFRPAEATGVGLEKRLVRVEGAGAFGRGPHPTGYLWPLASTRGALAILVVLALAFTPALAANPSKANNAAKEIERGAKKIGEGVKETAKGIGRTVSEGAKETGDRFKEAGRAATPPAKSVWQNIKAAASSFGQSVKNFFSRLFGKG